jgi:hypothetical protein
MGGTTAGGTPGSSAGGGGSGAPAATGGGSSLDCSKPKAAAVRLRLLSSTQYDHTILDLFKVGGEPAQVNALGDKVFQPLDDTQVDHRANAAADIAKQAATTLSSWAPCTPPMTGSTTACEQQIIDKVGQRVYRRPLSNDDRTQLQTLFDAGIKAKDFATGVEWLLSGLLQSPDFMYEITRPVPSEVPGEVRPLGPYEYAGRLAYFIWDGPPDDALLTAANQLGDAPTRDAQVARMLQDARFTRGIEQFYSRFLNVGAFTEVARDAPGFDQNVVTALATSILMSAKQPYANGNPTLGSLFSGESYYMNDALKKFYGLSGATNASFTLTPMPGENRRGLLTHPGLMASLARPDESNPIARGLFVLRRLLCTDIPPPPVGLTIPQLTPVQNGLSTRDRLEAHTSDAVCNSCHKTIDPPGFALENFDAVGKFRATDQGVPVDTADALTLGFDTDGAFATGDAFLAKLSTSNRVKSCFAENYLNFALSRSTTDASDACSIEDLGRTFGANGDLKQLVVSVAKSNSFTMRLAEGVGQ